MIVISHTYLAHPRSEARFLGAFWSHASARVRKRGPHPSPVVHPQLIKGENMEHAYCIFFDFFWHCVHYIVHHVRVGETKLKFLDMGSGGYPSNQSANHSFTFGIEQHMFSLSLSIHWGVAPKSPGICHGQPYFPCKVNHDFLAG